MINIGICDDDKRSLILLMKKKFALPSSPMPTA